MRLTGRRGQKNSGKVLLSTADIAQLNTQTAAGVESFVDLVTYPPSSACRR